MSKEKENNEEKFYQEFEKSNFKWLFILNKWLGPAWMDLYKNKDIAYYLGLFLWMIFVMSKFLPNNYNIIIDHTNILNFLNVILIFVFLIMMWFVIWLISIIIIDIFILIFGFLFKYLWKLQECIFKKNWFVLAIESDKKFNIYRLLNIIPFILFMTLLILGFTLQTKDNIVTIKTTYSQESFTWVLDYYSGENYIMRWWTWYLVIPKDKVEYLFYPKIEQKKTWNQ